MGWGGSRRRNTDRMNKNRIQGQRARGEAALDAYARYSVKREHGKFSLRCVCTSFFITDCSRLCPAELTFFKSLAEPDSPVPSYQTALNRALGLLINRKKHPLPWAGSIAGQCPLCNRNMPRRMSMHSL